MLLDINLLPKAKKEEARDKRYKYLATVIFLVVVGGCLAATGLMYFYKQNQVNAQKTAQAELKTAQDEQVKLKDTKEKLLLLQKQLTAINSADANKLSKFFVKINEITLTYISFSSFNLTGSGKIDISAESSDYDQAAYFVTSLKETFPQTTVGAFSKGESEEDGNVTFTVTVNFDQAKVIEIGK